MKKEIIELINNYWKFDNEQQPISSWHDKQDLLKEIENFFTKNSNQQISEKFILKYKNEIIGEKILYSEIYAKDICQAIDIFWKTHDVLECQLIDDDLVEININGVTKIVNSNLYGNLKNKDFELNNIDTISEFKDEYAWLSNFYQCEITYNNITYPSVENAYQAQKSNDPNWKKYCQESSPGKVKTVSKKIDLIEDWDKNKENIMLDLLKRKFEQPIFCKKLINTKKANIVEYNDWGDTFWGVCKKTKKGNNLLGLMIMSIRATYFDMMLSTLMELLHNNKDKSKRIIVDDFIKTTPEILYYYERVFLYNLKIN